MAAKKTVKKSPKEIKKNVKIVEKTQKKPVTKKKEVLLPKKKVAPLVSKTKTANISAPQTKISKKAEEIFKGYYREGDRIFLRAPKKFSGFPDLLALQKK
ncbi:MAG: hypothetical protein WCJ39_01465 [bacterium]